MVGLTCSKLGRMEEEKRGREVCCSKYCFIPARLWLQGSSWKSIWYTVVLHQYEDGSHLNTATFAPLDHSNPLQQANVPNTYVYNSMLAS